MGLYAIGDLHLSLSADKPMDVFGGRWEQYTEKISEGFSHLQPDDVTVLCGDISWAMGLDESAADVERGGERELLLGDRDDEHFEQRRRLQRLEAVKRTRN